MIALPSQGIEGRRGSANFLKLFSFSAVSSVFPHGRVVSFKRQKMAQGEEEGEKRRKRDLDQSATFVQPREKALLLIIRRGKRAEKCSFSIFCSSRQYFQSHFFLLIIQTRTEVTCWKPGSLSCFFLSTVRHSKPTDASQASQKRGEGVFFGRRGRKRKRRVGRDTKDVTRMLKTHLFGGGDREKGVKRTGQLGVSPLSPERRIEGAKRRKEESVFNES